MSLRLYNTLTRKKEDFVPLDPKNVRMYVCGPTVYDFAHIGNARPVIVFDVLFRLLKHLYEKDGGKVTYVRNITDVDDKINARAQELAKEKKISVMDAIREITAKTAKQYEEDVTALGCLKPTHEPRATDHIKQMIVLIEKLVAAKHAYVAEGHVLYDVSSKPDYGKLSRRSLDEMIAGARVEVAPYKKNPMDFVLWKPSTPELPGWNSPWGRGRPGWHIECSAMAEAYLGETFDIHGGGIDLLFPHHENEIAQSEGAHPRSQFAHFWLHNGFLQMEGEKMSKSLGNFVTIRDLLTGWKGYPWRGEVLRFNMLKTNYRDPLDWTFESLDESHKILWDWFGFLKDRPAAKSGMGAAPSVIEILCDDLNTSAAITEMHAMRKSGDFGSLRASLEFFGFSGDRAKIARHPVLAADTGKYEITGYPAGGTVGSQHEGVPLPLFDAEIRKLIAARDEARRQKNFKEADSIRADLDSKGIILHDQPDGTTTWEVKR